MLDKFFVFIMGSIVGSFLNVCISRLPVFKSVVTPGSHCPVCKKRIRWHDNVPILSYLILKGRCRDCGAKIAFRYFLVELITAGLFLILFITFGLTAKFFAYALLTACLVIATFVDFEIGEIPDEVTVAGLIAGLIFSLLYPSLFGKTVFFKGLMSSALGALAGGASIYLIGFFGEIVFKKEAMGGGDVKLMAMIGSLLGWKLVMLTFFIAPVFGSIVGIILKIRAGRETIPYGPYLSLGALISIFWGERILSVLFYGLH